MQQVLPYINGEISSKIILQNYSNSTTSCISLSTWKISLQCPRKKRGWLILIIFIIRLQKEFQGSQKQSLLGNIHHNNADARMRTCITSSAKKNEDIAILKKRKYRAKFKMAKLKSLTHHRIMYTSIQNVECKMLKIIPSASPVIH